MLYEDLRASHEDIERLECAIADRQYQTKHLRQRLNRDHQISALLSRLQEQSQRALDIYTHEQQKLLEEVQSISTGEPLDAFYERLAEVKSFHERNPNEPVENLERVYRDLGEGGGGGLVGDLDGMFTGEEQFGQFFDLTQLHEQYLNLPGIRSQRKIGYMQYLDVFDIFTPPQNTLSRQDKLTEDYFSYVDALAQYLEGFIKRTQPLENLEALFASFSDEFETQWQSGSVPGWEASSHSHTNGTTSSSHPMTEGTGEGIWCADCEKEFKNDNVYKAHLTGKKHIKNAEMRKQHGGEDMEMSNATSTTASAAQRLKEKAIAEREHRIRRLSSTLKSVREETRVNVERKAGMTDRERQQELAALYAEDASASIIPSSRQRDDDDEADDDGDEKVYNPLKLPLAWDGKPIPFWLYKLHGLGVEFPCAICGGYVYMGRRAFDKHFSEARHVYGLKCLGITGNLGLYREITEIEEAVRLAEKVARDKEVVGKKGEGVEEMEDGEGNVMPARVWEDLRRQGLL